MSGAIFFALAVLVGIGAGALAWTQARRAASPTRGDPAALARALRRVPIGERVAELARRAEPGTWERALGTDVLAASGSDAQVAAVNLALAEVDHALREGEGWPAAGLRIALLGAALLAFAAWLEERRLTWPLAVLVVGGAAAVTCVEAGRSAKRSAARQRQAIDDLVTVVFGDRPSGPEERAPERRARRRGVVSAGSATSATRRRRDGRIA